MIVENDPLCPCDKPHSTLPLTAKVLTSPAKTGLPSLVRFSHHPSQCRLVQAQPYGSLKIKAVKLDGKENRSSFLSHIYAFYQKCTFSQRRLIWPETKKLILSQAAFRKKVGRKRYPGKNDLQRTVSKYCRASIKLRSAIPTIIQFQVNSKNY